MTGEKLRDCENLDMKVRIPIFFNQIFSAEV